MHIGTVRWTLTSASTPTRSSASAWRCAFRFWETDSYLESRLPDIISRDSDFGKVLQFKKRAKRRVSSSAFHFNSLEIVSPPFPSLHPLSYSTFKSSIAVTKASSNSSFCASEKSSASPERCTIRSKRAQNFQSAVCCWLSIKHARDPKPSVPQSTTHSCFPQIIIENLGIREKKLSFVKCAAYRSVCRFWRVHSSRTSPRRRRGPARRARSSPRATTPARLTWPDRQYEG